MGASILRSAPQEKQAEGLGYCFGCRLVPARFTAVRYVLGSFRAPGPGFLRQLRRPRLSASLAEAARGARATVPSRLVEFVVEPGSLELTDIAKAMVALVSHARTPGARSVLLWNIHAGRPPLAPSAMG